MWSDNEANIDWLRFGFISTSINKIINNNKLSPTTIGLFGDWGSGKSTLLRMSKVETEKNKHILWIDFNGWLFEGYTDARSALMSVILEQIKARLEKEKGFTGKAKDLLTNLSRKINWLNVALTAGKYAGPALLGAPYLSAGFAISDFTSFLKDQLKGMPDALSKLDEDAIKKFIKESPDTQEDVRKSIREFREDFEKLIVESKIEKLVVSIDDLDRCLPDTVIETLEAIRLFLFVPNTVFIVAADERLVEYAVTKRFPVLPSGNNLDVGREYLEKMVQIPIRVPPLNPLDLRAYMNLLMAEKSIQNNDDLAKIAKHVSTFFDADFTKCSFDSEVLKSILPEIKLAELADDFKLVNQVAEVLAVGLNGSPRRTKRFLNALTLRMEMATARGLKLRRDILAKLMLVEYLRPAFFKELAGLQAKENGYSSVLKATELFIRKKGQSALVNEAWASDEWMRTWLMVDPSFENVDLRPYFYIAYDRLGNVGHNQNRMSQVAQVILTKLLSSEDIDRKLGGKEAMTLAEADVSAIFEAITDRILKLDELADSNEEKAIEQLMESVPKVIPQVISMYSQISVSMLDPGIVVAIESRSRGTAWWQACKGLLEIWSSQSENKPLKTAAEARKQDILPTPGKRK